jgi:hypothetical protein
MTRPAGVARSQRRAQPTAVARRSKSLPVLRSNKLDKVFTYGIMATWGTHLSHLGTAVDGGGGW